MKGAEVSWPRGGGVARATWRRPAGSSSPPWSAGGRRPGPCWVGSWLRSVNTALPAASELGAPCSLASPQVSPEDRRSLCRQSGNHRALGSGSGGPEKGCLGWCGRPGRGAGPGLSPQQPGNREAAPRPSLALRWLGCWVGHPKAARAGVVRSRARRQPASPSALGPGRPHPCASTFPSGNGRVG